MKTSRRFRTMLIVIVLLGCASVAFSQSWQPLQHQPTFNASTSLLLTDGTVMVHQEGARQWWKLTPDLNGSYVNGTWTQMASLPSNYSPLYYASAVLPDGRLIVEGGEYNFGSPVWTNLGAIYDPLANTWTAVNPPSGWGNIGDAQSVILPNGTFMLANALTTQQAWLNAATLTWTSTGSGKADSNNEEGWTLLPNGLVLTVDTNSNNTHAERYSPRLGKWGSAGSTIVQLTDPGSHEIGPAVLRANGTVLATGGTGHNAIYTPSPTGGPGTWVAGPDFPKVNGQQLDIADGPAALLPNGNVLCDTSPGVFQNGVHFFEFDGTQFIAVPGTPDAMRNTSFEGRMLVLPTGQIFFADGTKDVEIYTPIGNPDPAWAPTIHSVPTQISPGGSYTLSGTQLNGLSEGAAYGDDAQAATNYPLVRITNRASGHVFFARTHDHSGMSVAPGRRGSTHFDVPANIEIGSSDLAVVTNGIASTPVTVTVR